jgi:hypothetical protein
MINTKNLAIQITDIPSYWVFQYYLDLNQVLTGQDIKIKSIWNNEDTDPSMCIYVDRIKQVYMFKDFSSGKGGNKINLVQYLFNVNYPVAVEKIIKDYNENPSAKVNLKVEAKWKLDFYKERPWNKDDANYWLQFRIGTTILKKFNVKAIDYYTLIKEDDQLSQIKIRDSRVYGFCDTQNSLYKVYQPFSKKGRRFFNIFSRMQGLDQLKYDQPYLVICSSLKDAMCLSGFGYNIEVVAPNSENTLIKPYVIENLKNKYKKIITLFDNDKAGKNAITKYKCVYNINGIYLDMSKDLSDSVRDYGFEKVHQQLKPLLKKAIHGK